ncbi:MAG TPA: amidase [Actinopolymorphaceae bacterium]
MTPPLVEAALARIAEVDRAGPMLRSVITTNPQATRPMPDVPSPGPLHGVPVLVKDNIDTVDMPTTAGSLALANVPVVADAPLVTRLRQAGAVILGKTNLSEWANFRSPTSSSGWSAVGGLTLNPHALDRSAGGSSSGSAAAVAAGITRFAVGTETDGSIVCPAALCGVVGLKPTVGSIPGIGIVPISHSQDTAGPITATVAEAALLQAVLSGQHPRTYVDHLAPDALRGARIGVPRNGYWGYSPRADAVCEEAVRLLAACGATIVDPAPLPSSQELAASNCEDVVLTTEFKVDVEAYLARRPGGPRTLQDLVTFNTTYADVELRHFGQERFERALSAPGPDDPAYHAALATAHRLGRDEGIDAALRANGLDALVAPAFPPAWKIDLVNGDQVAGGCSTVSAIAGYPLLTVPCGEVDGLPVGLAFMGTAWSEGMLLRLGYAFEQALGFELKPAFRAPRAG